MAVVGWGSVGVGWLVWLLGGGVSAVVREETEQNSATSDSPETPGGCRPTIATGEVTIMDGKIMERKRIERE